MRKENIFDDCFYGNLPIGLFRLEKSYDQILADHSLIRQMKRIMEGSGRHRYFEVMIKEAYFRCGVILIRPCIHEFGDYIKIFHKKERMLEELKDEGGIRERIVTCMTHLLLSTRKSNSEGTASILDEIKRECIDFRYGWQPKNPFEKLLDIKRPHNIDFGVRALPLNAEEWQMANWTGVVFGGMETNIFDFEKYPPSYSFDESAFHAELVKRVLEIIDALGFKTQGEQLEILDLIVSEMMCEGCGDHWPECKEIYEISCSNCSECEVNIYNEQAAFCNPLLERAYDEVKGIIASRFKKTKSNDRKNQIAGDIIDVELHVEETGAEIQGLPLKPEVPRTVKDCFKFPNDFVKKNVQAVVYEFYLNSPANLAIIERTLFDHNVLKSLNSHTPFIRALMNWGILPKDTEIKKTANGMSAKLKKLPKDGYKKWSNDYLNDRTMCIDIAGKLDKTMKYRHNE